MPARDHVLHINSHPGRAVWRLREAGGERRIQVSRTCFQLCAPGQAPWIGWSVLLMRSKCRPRDELASVCVNLPEAPTNEKK